MTFTLIPILISPSLSNSTITVNLPLLAVLLILVTYPSNSLSFKEANLTVAF